MAGITSSDRLCTLNDSPIRKNMSIIHRAEREVLRQYLVIHQIINAENNPERAYTSLSTAENQKVSEKA